MQRNTFVDMRVIKLFLKAAVAEHVITYAQTHRYIIHNTVFKEFMMKNNASDFFFDFIYSKKSQGILLSPFLWNIPCITIETVASHRMRTRENYDQDRHRSAKADSSNCKYCNASLYSTHIMCVTRTRQFICITKAV